MIHKKNNGGMKRKTPPNNLGIAACAISVTPTGEVQLFPAGKFRAVDGRPKDAPHWFVDAKMAASIIADFEARQNDTVIDYEHQTMLASQNGQPAPAAGCKASLSAPQPPARRALTCCASKRI